MSLFVLPLAVLAVLAALLIALGAAFMHALRAAMAIRSAAFEVTPSGARPGEGIRLTARIVPRGAEQLAVRATLLCTMFDHRGRSLYENRLHLAPVVGRPGHFAAFVRLPNYALRTGVVGDTLSNLFSEDAHRLLIFWSIDFEVVRERAPGVVLIRESVPLEVPDGQPLQPDRTYMDAVIVQSCAAMHSDLVLNWLVRLAGSDGVLDPRERQLLHDVLRDAHGVSDPAAADARIAVEMQRDLQIDPVLLRKHVPPEALTAFFRFLYVMAWRDGVLDGREHNFLIEALTTFGLDESTVDQVERDVLRGFAQHAIH